MKYCSSKMSNTSLEVSDKGQGQTEGYWTGEAQQRSHNAYLNAKDMQGSFLPEKFLVSSHQDRAKKVDVRVSNACGPECLNKHRCIELSKVGFEDSPTFFSTVHTSVHWTNSCCQLTRNTVSSDFNNICRSQDFFSSLLALE
eukprot:GFUD01039043.1.p1 GENE.GFUD01039043.1~~GFUD01039043.1.p1  ORF type:complete len:142 (-),score=24.65 GFUD01039043.1:282-707(-)